MLSSTIDFQPRHFVSAKDGHLCSEQPRPLRRRGCTLRCSYRDGQRQTFVLVQLIYSLRFLRMKAEGKSHHGPEQNKR